MAIAELNTQIFFGDIGGTKTLLQLAEVNDAEILILQTRKYPSQEFASFADMIEDFFQQAETNPTISAACFAVAGPVINHQKAKLTNLSWAIDSSEIAAQFSFPQIMILNDFEAAALGIDALSSDDVVVLQTGLTHPLGMRVILGAGTGMGVSWSASINGRRYPFPSEAGHIDFAATDNLQIDLWKALQKKWGHVSVERLLSGSGLTDIFKFLQDSQKTKGALVYGLPEDSGAVITELALKQHHRVAIQALELFVTIYGAYAGNLALAGLCRGGVYIAGGIAPKILKIMEAGGFLQAFCDKGRFSQLMHEIPVHLVINSEIGLLGARLTACDLLNPDKQSKE